MNKEQLQEKLSIAIEECPDIKSAIQKFKFSPLCNEEVGEELLILLTK